MRHEIIYKLYPNIVNIDDGVGMYDANGNEVIVDEDLIQEELSRANAQYDAKEYQRLRAQEYPAIADQLDYIYHNGIDAWKEDMIDPVKNKYPKG